MISCGNVKMSPPTMFLVVSHLPIFIAVIACLPNDYLRNFPLDYWRMTFASMNQGRDSLCASLLGSNGVWGWAGSEWISAPSIECTLVWWVWPYWLGLHHLVLISPGWNWWILRGNLCDFFFSREMGRQMFRPRNSSDFRIPKLTHPNEATKSYFDLPNWMLWYRQRHSKTCELRPHGPWVTLTVGDDFQVLPLDTTTVVVLGAWNFGTEMEGISFSSSAVQPEIGDLIRSFQLDQIPRPQEAANTSLASGVTWRHWGAHGLGMGWFFSEPMTHGVICGFLRPVSHPSLRDRPGGSTGIRAIFRSKMIQAPGKDNTFIIHTRDAEDNPRTTDTWRAQKRWRSWISGWSGHFLGKSTAKVHQNLVSFFLAEGSFLKDCTIFLGTHSTGSSQDRRHHGVFDLRACCDAVLLLLGRPGWRSTG